MVRAARRTRLPARRAEGQSLVEFALVLTPMMLILLGIIQFGFIFNTYVTLTNATREAARAGSIYVYDRTLTKAQNDAARNSRIKSSLTASMNLLTKTAPNFTTGGTWSQTGQTFSNGDLTVAFALPSGVTDAEPRTGQQLTVSAVYHQNLVIPLISALLPHDGGGRLALTGAVTMVIN